MCAHLTDYRLQRKCLYDRQSNEWIRCGNIVRICIIRIRLTVDIAPICYQDKSITDVALVRMSCRIRSDLIYHEAGLDVG